MDRTRVFPVRVAGGTTTVLLSAGQMVEAAERGRLVIAPEGAEEATKGSPDEHGSLFDALEEVSRSVPDEVWEGLPTDLSENHDHYICGAPKR